MPIASNLPDVKPLAEDAANPRIGIGGNMPPPEEVIPQAFRSALLEKKATFFTRVDQLLGKPAASEGEEPDLGAVGRCAVVDDETLMKAGDLRNLINEHIRVVEEVHKQEKEPYLKGGRLVDAEKRALVDRLEAAKTAVQRIGDAYVADRDAKAKAERDRIAAIQRQAEQEAWARDQERLKAQREAEQAAANAVSAAEREDAQERAAIAARLAREAELAAAAVVQEAAPAKVEPLRSDMGSTVSSKQDWKSEILDYDTAYIAVSDDTKVQEAISAAIQRRVKAGSRTIDGVRIYGVAKATFR